jgi:hypothetical protein
MPAVSNITANASQLDTEVRNYYAELKKRFDDSLSSLAPTNGDCALLIDFSAAHNQSQGISGIPGAQDMTRSVTFYQDLLLDDNNHAKQGYLYLCV